MMAIKMINMSERLQSSTHEAIDWMGKNWMGFKTLSFWRDFMKSYICRDYLIYDKFVIKIPY